MAFYLYKLRTPTTVSSVAIVFEDTSYGIGLKNAFKTAFEDLGGTVSLEVSHVQNLYMQDISAAQAVIQQLASAPTPPQMVVSVSLEKDTLKLVQAWDNGGSPMVSGMQWFLADGARSQGFLDAAPTSMRGMCGTAPTYPVDGVAFDELRKAYEAKYDDSIDAQIYAPNVWDGFHLISAAAVQQSRQHPDDDLGGANLRDALTEVSKGGQTFHSGQWRDLVSALRTGNDVDYDGAGGPMDFDVVGQTVGPYEVWCLALDGSKFEQKLFLNATDIQKLLQ
jgi:ABC-type branched-subunit amino acid transport system substrate-binding protein